MKRVLILTDHSLVGHTIRMALRQAAGFQVVGMVDGRHSARAQLAELRPDVVLVDDMESRQQALARLREVAEEAALADCLLLTAAMTEDWLSQAFDAGASAVVSKTVHPLAFGTLLREIVRGNVVQRPRARPPAAAAAACPLTSRELEILRLASQGMTNAQIACRLWVTQQTVKFHLSNTYRKLGVANRTEASLYAHVNDLVAPNEHQLAS
jgi:DNA-binding NarL/FixJ family response regulator